MKLAFLILALLFSCGKRDKQKEIEEFSRHDELEKKYHEVLKEAGEHFDRETGWPSREDCDGTLWAGLAKASGVGSVQLDLADYGKSGQIHRRPYNPCWANDQDLGSASTVSRDMILGYMWGADKDAIKRLAEYGESKNWVMGAPYPKEAARVLLTGNLIGLLGRMNCEYNDICKNYKNIPPLYTRDNKDYVTHLTVLYILLNSRDVKTVSITSEEKDMLKWLVEVDPQNATFEAAKAMYTDESFDRAAALLLDGSYLPSYVRGHPNYRYVYWLFSAYIILNHYNQ